MAVVLHQPTETLLPPAPPTVSAEPIPGRTFALLDVENLARGHRLDTAAALYALSAGARAAALPADAQWVTGSSRANLLRAAHLIRATFGRTGRLKACSGLNGGEFALFEGLDDEGGFEMLTRRGFRHLVIGSGDHALTGAARAAHVHGMYVTVVAPRGSLANILQHHADEVRIYEPDPIALGDLPRTAA